MAKQVWERHTYTNREIQIIINGEIIEYDIRAAGLSLAKQFGYLPEKVTKHLESLDKANRNRKLGLLKRYNKQLTKKENEAFIEARKLFIKSNNLNVDEIVAIKRDAIFVTRRCNTRKFGEIEFVPKNIYTSYMEFDEIELYYNSRCLDVKGINDVVIQKHEEYMLDFFKQYLELLESGKDSKLKEFITNFVYRYKTRMLDIGYYREFNASSSYRLREVIENCIYSIDTIDSSCFDDVDISYNYFKYLVPLCTMLI